METRKPHAMKLNDVTGRLLDFIGDDSQTANKVRSQVADVFDVWNNLCKKNIENTSKVWRYSHEHSVRIEAKRVRPGYRRCSNDVSLSRSFH